MKLKMNQVVKTYEFLSQMFDEKFPLATSYKLSLLKNTLQDDYDFYNQKVNQYIDLYAEKDENGNIKKDNPNSIILKADKISECQEKLKELNQMDLEIKEVTFKLDELESTDLTFGEVQILFPFIKE